MGYLFCPLQEIIIPSNNRIRKKYLMLTSVIRSRSRMSIVNCNCVKMQRSEKVINEKMFHIQCLKFVHQ